MKNNLLNTRFGEEGKLWHIGALVIVGVVLWAIAVDVAYACYRVMTG